MVPRRRKARGYSEPDGKQHCARSSSESVEHEPVLLPNIHLKFEWRWLLGALIWPEVEPLVISVDHLRSSEKSSNRCERSKLRLVDRPLCANCVFVCVCVCCCVVLCGTSDGKMAVVPPLGKNKLKMGNAGRYYSAYLIYNAANSCLASLHARMPPLVVTRTNPPSPMHVQNPRKFSSLSVFSIFPRWLFR